MKVRSWRRRPGARKGAALITLTVAMVALSSCSNGGYSDEVHASGEFSDMIKPAISVLGGDTPLEKDAVGVAPGTKVVVKATDGAISGVNIAKSDGTPLAGDFSEDGSTWTSSEVFGYNRTYTVQAEALGVGGKTTTAQSFTTSAPNTLTAAYISPAKGSKVGVAQTIGVRFDEAIKDRQAAQDAIAITTTPSVEGAFYWISANEVRWRPEHFWKPGTKVDVKVNTYGIDLGDGMFGQENVSSNFTVERDLQMEVDDSNKIVYVKRDGKVIREMPTSMGKADTPTPNGTYIIGDRVDHIIMDSSTYGVPVGSADGYRTPVDYATQMSYSGIYLHAAPWSLWAQGNTNTSHGCLNLSPEDALWVVRNTLRGDPVKVTGTVGEDLAGTDGLGDWNIPWSTWSKGNTEI